MVNLKTTIKDLRGEELPQSFNTKKDLEKIKDAEGKINEDLLPRETVGNILLNALSFYQVENGKEATMVRNCADMIVSSQDGTIDPNAKHTVFMAKVMRATTNMKSNEERQRLFAAWTASQVLEALGDTEDAEDEK